MASLPDCYDKSSETFSCGACNKVYTVYKSLQRHVKKSHPNEINDLAPSLKNRKSFELKCEYCSNQFTHAYHLNAHMQKVHNYDTATKVLQKCAICNFESSKEDILNHFEQQHNFKIDELILNFKDLGEFESWKKSIEKKTNSKFVLERGIKKTKNGWNRNFICHRSGFYIPSGKGLRHLKTQGSCKINGFCPAAIKVHRVVDNSYSVRYYSTHVGHHNDIGHLTMNEEDRQFIASKVASKVPFDDILNEIRDSINNSDLNRIHLITKKDLYNSVAYKKHSNAQSQKRQQDEYDFAAPPLSIENETQNSFSEKIILVEELSKTNYKSQSCNQSFLDKRKTVRERYVAFIDSIEAEEDLKILEEGLISMPLKVEANKSARKSFSTFKKNKFPSNKNINPQRLFSSKRKRKSTNKNVVKKPKQEEINKIVISLLMNKNNINK